MGSPEAAITIYAMIAAMPTAILNKAANKFHFFMLFFSAFYCLLNTVFIIVVNFGGIP